MKNLKICVEKLWEVWKKIIRRDVGLFVNICKYWSKNEILDTNTIWNLNCKFFYWNMKDIRSIIFKILIWKWQRSSTINPILPLLLINMLISILQINRYRISSRWTSITSLLHRLFPFNRRAWKKKREENQFVGKHRIGTRHSSLI